MGKFQSLLLANLGLVSALSPHTPQILDKNNKYVDTAALVIKQNRVKAAVLAIWEKDLVSGDTASSIWDNEFTTLESYSCGNSTASYAAGIQVKFNVDSFGVGGVKVNDMNYEIGGDPATTGGISCSQIYNPYQVSVHCYLPIDLTLKKRDFANLGGNSTAECFKSPGLADTLFGIIRGSGDGLVESPAIGFFSNDTEVGTVDQGTALVARARQVRVEGNGSPYKWKRHTNLVSLR
jgi:hypothetical protein